MDRAARDSSGIGMATPRLWTASCINRDVHCSADSPRAAPDCVTDAAVDLTAAAYLWVQRPDVGVCCNVLFISSMAACAAAPS